jgi:hypothetical protein
MIFKSISGSNINDQCSVAQIKANNNGEYIPQTKKHTVNAIAHLDSFYEWHQRLEHLLASALPELRNLVADPEALPKSGAMKICNTCFDAKSKKTPYPHITSHTTEILELVHTDLSGKISVSSISGYDY